MDKFVADCGERSSLPRCGRLRRVVNESSQPIEVQGIVSEATQWHTIIPFVAHHSQLRLPFEALWLPRNMILRSVVPGTNEELEMHGVLADGLSLIFRGDAPMKEQA